MDHEFSTTDSNEPVVGSHWKQGPFASTKPSGNPDRYDRTICLDGFSKARHSKCVIPRSHEGLPRSFLVPRNTGIDVQSRFRRRRVRPDECRARPNPECVVPGLEEAANVDMHCVKSVTSPNEVERRRERPVSTAHVDLDGTDDVIPGTRENAGASGAAHFSPQW